VPVELRSPGGDGAARAVTVRAASAAWIAVAVGAYLLERATGARWFLLAAACAGAPVLVSLVWRPRRTGLEVHAHDLPPRAVVGETVEQTVAVANTGRRALGAFTLTFRSPGYADLVVDVPALPAGGEAQATLPRQAVRRGGGGLHALTVATSAPFGLVERRLEGTYTAAPAFVHPAPVPPVDLPGRGGADGDEPTGLAARRGPQPHAVREWRPGDEVRQVHWRATARHGRLVVVEPERAIEQPLALVVAGRAGVPGWEDLVAVAAASVATAMADGRAVLLLTDDPHGGVGAGLAAGVLAPRDAGEAGDWFALLTAPRLPPGDLLRRAAGWAGPGGLVTIAATDSFVAEAVRTGTAGTPYGPPGTQAPARSELAVDGVPVALTFVLPRTAAPAPTAPVPGGTP
jgi:hypothetical protein